jgi:hypothetical protein
MSWLSDSDRFRKTVGGVCLIVAPLALFVGTLVHPGFTDNAPALLRMISQHRDAWYLTHILGWAFVILMIPAIFTLIHLLGERQVALGHIGATLALVGVIGFAGIVTIFGFVGGQMAIAGNQVQMAELFERLSHNAGVWIPVRGMTGALLPGFGCLAVALVRARAVPRWMPPTFAVGLVLFVLGMASGTTGAGILGTALMTIGMGSIGALVLRQEAGDWRSPGRLDWRSTA